MASTSHAELAVILLRDAAGLMRKVADQNPALSEQMRGNADVYETVAELLSTNPNGTVELDDVGPTA